jgi:predicted RNase H-like HicB family nuclease
MKGFDIVINVEKVKNKKIYVAHCLNLGVVSQGSSYEEAGKNIREAIELYLEECPEEAPKESLERLEPPMATRIFL